jgi:hypothetical protein
LAARDRSESRRVLGVAIIQKVTTGTQDAASVHGRIAGDLLHPWLVRMGGDAGDVHTAALEVNDEQDVVGHQSSKRQNLDREEVGCREEGEVGPNEFRSGGRTFAFLRGRYTVVAQHIVDCLIGDIIPEIGEQPTMRS